MNLHGTDWAVTTALVAVGSAAVYAGLARLLGRANAERQRETDRQLSALVTTVKLVQARVTELARLQAAAVREREAAAISAESESKAKPRPETLAALAAAATAFLGRKARIRAVQAQPSEQDNAGAWAQQGRVIVQTSHSPRPRN